MNFKDLPEEEKLKKIYILALKDCQGILFALEQYYKDYPDLDKYKNYLQEVIDYIAEKNDLLGISLYPADKDGK